MTKDIYVYKKGNGELVLKLDITAKKNKIIWGKNIPPSIKNAGCTIEKIEIKKGENKE